MGVDDSVISWRYGAARCWSLSNAGRAILVGGLLVPLVLAQAEGAEAESPRTSSAVYTFELREAPGNPYRIEGDLAEKPAGAILPTRLVRQDSNPPSDVVLWASEEGLIGEPDPWGAAGAGTPLGLPCHQGRDSCCWASPLTTDPYWRLSEGESYGSPQAAATSAGLAFVGVVRGFRDGLHITGVPSRMHLIEPIEWLLGDPKETRSWYIVSVLNPRVEIGGAAFCSAEAAEEWIPVPPAVGDRVVVMAPKFYVASQVDPLIHLQGAAGMSLIVFPAAGGVARSNGPSEEAYAVEDSWPSSAEAILDQLRDAFFRTSVGER